MLIGHIHTNAGLDNNGIVFFTLKSQGLPFIKVMAGLEYTVWEMNVMPTVAYLNKIVLGVGVLSWYGRASHMAFALILLLSKGIWMPNAPKMKFLRGKLSLCFKLMPI